MRRAERERGDRVAERVRRVAWAGLAFPVLLVACRVQVDGSEAGSTTPPPAAMATDTLRAGCPDFLPALPMRAPIGLGVEAGRLLGAEDGLLVVGSQGGLYRHTNGGTERLLRGGRDYALRGEMLVRLEEDRVELFDYRPWDRPAPRSTLPAQSHDTSIAILERGAFVHSGFNRSALVLERSIRDGAVVAALLPVERDLFRTLLLGPELLHEDEGILTAGGRWLLHVPRVRDPVQAVDIGERRRWVLELARGRSGKVRVDGRARRDVQPCPGCARRVELRGRVTVVPLYAGATVAGDVFWILRLDPAGGPRAVLLRVAAERPDVRAWQLAFPTAPAALAVWRDSLAVAAGTDLWRLPLPEPDSGAACSVVGSEGRS